MARGKKTQTSPKTIQLCTRCGVNNQLNSLWTTCLPCQDEILKELNARDMLEIVVISDTPKNPTGSAGSGLVFTNKSEKMDLNQGTLHLR